MKWIMIIVVLVICYVIYSKRKNTVTLTKDQAEVALEAIKENLENIEKERQEIINQGAAEGKTISIEDIFSHTNGDSEEVQKEIEKLKAELKATYGENIPVDEAYRLAKEFDPDI